ncbi:glycosyl hydrolase family 32 [Subtercola sp. RTI3]|uniref:glycosyl hydrolase family 32 n=1 Tax=Subtercola sp. RTI3 TaxID=3048639 RepID=UPI002B23940F|nr:glycosyl hydrolase family 32 [Subtercola sp. RTI3]MEA9985621.1 glycosyl hydrolase family 32 [Subtercola sp. RTI3]
MTFSLPHHWVWDFWTVLDDGTVHLFYLHAPHSLGDPELRHRNASIGHATSTDFINWTDRGVVLGHGAEGDADESATWTGSVFRGPDGVWRMYYTGSRFLSPTETTNIETVLLATSTDLHTWLKQPETALSASLPWYETLADGTWREEAWRDPWIEVDPAGNGWHMLITARARALPAGADSLDRGVIGHAVSGDLATWRAREPLSSAGAGFAHLEVLQLAVVEGREVLVFSCDSAHLVGQRAGSKGGIWAVPIVSGSLFTGELVDLDRAQLVVGEELYAGRIVQTANGAALLGFENEGLDGAFVGRLSDPRPLYFTQNGRLLATAQERTR